MTTMPKSPTSREVQGTGAVGTAGAASDSCTGGAMTVTGCSCPASEDRPRPAIPGRVQDATETTTRHNSAATQPRRRDPAIGPLHVNVKFRPVDPRGLRRPPADREINLL